MNPEEIDKIEQDYLRDEFGAHEEEKSEEAKETQSKRTIADGLVDLTLNSGIELYLDQLGEPQIAFPDQRVCYPIKSTTFKRWLSGKYWEQTQKGFSGETFLRTVASLEGKAYHEKNKIPLYNRLGLFENKLYYDLGDDTKVVEISGSGWNITDYCPIKFRRFAHQKEQVTPDHNGDLTELINFINISKPNDQLLLLTYILAICFPDIPRVLLSLIGDQGSAKSTALRVIRSLIDPSVTELLSPPSDINELGQMANHHYLLYLDNLSYLKDELSDSLCRLSTGIAFSKRRLYSDDEDIIFAQKIAVGISGVNLVATRADLLDRCLILSLERIPENSRRDETEFWTEFELAKPRILGGLFNTLSKVLGIYPNLKLIKKPRMADYAKYAASAAVALGYTADDFLSAYGENTGRQNQAAIESSPTAQVVIQFMSDKDYWEGLASELHDQLLQLATKLNLDIGGRDGFPKASNWLWRKITPIRPNLMALGIEPRLKDTESGSLIQLSKDDQNGSNTSSASIQSQNSTPDDNSASINASMPKDEITEPKTASMAAMQASKDTSDDSKEVEDELPF